MGDCFTLVAILLCGEKKDDGIGRIKEGNWYGGGIIGKAATDESHVLKPEGFLVSGSESKFTQGVLQVVATPREWTSTSIKKPSSNTGASGLMMYMEARK